MVEEIKENEGNNGQIPRRTSTKNQPNVARD